LQRADPAVHLARREERRRARKVVIYDEDDSIARQETKTGRTIDEVRADVMAA
jgi:hypothetical protein